MRPRPDARYAVRHVERGPHRLQGALGFEQCEGAPHDVARLDELERFLLRAGVIQQAADDAVKTIELPRKAADHLGIRSAAAQHFHVGPHRPEGVPDLVRDPRRQPPDARELLGTDQLTLGVERSEEHTSELQSLAYLVCRLLLEKKKKKKIY